MKNNRRRKFTTYKFFVEGQVCKIFFHPQKEFKKGFWIWNVGFAVGNSNRQLNDWYWKRKNKRSRSVHRQMTGKIGMKGVTKFFKEILKLRWILEPGDVFYCDCTSNKPEQQFKVGLGLLKITQTGLLIMIKEYFFGIDHHIQMIKSGILIKL